jgi:chromosome segregation ATPase
MDEETRKRIELLEGALNRLNEHLSDVADNLENRFARSVERLAKDIEYVKDDVRCCQDDISKLERSR